MDNVMWKDIPHYEGLYQISDQGQVWSIKRQIHLKPRYDKDGYVKVALYKNGKAKYEFVHRLVALAFCDKPEGTNIVNHLNEIKDDNRAINLAWTTTKDNLNYGTRNERISKALKGVPKSEEHKQALRIAQNKDKLRNGDNVK